MFTRVVDHHAFLRLDPGEEIVESLRSFARENGVRSAAILSGVGMLSRARLGFFEVELNDYRPAEFSAIYDLSAVTGSITWRGEQPVPHVHVVFNNPEMSAFAGHLLEGICHITVELFIVILSDLNLVRHATPGRPATRIIGGEIDGDREDGHS